MPCRLCSRALPPSHNLDALLTLKMCLICACQVERWNPCPPLPGCISVNIGDPLQFWSDGLLKSNYHRVRPPLEGESKVRSALHCMHGHGTGSLFCSKARSAA